MVGLFPFGWRITAVSVESRPKEVVTGRGTWSDSTWGVRSLKARRAAKKAVTVCGGTGCRALGQIDVSGHSALARALGELSP
jgi:hypothetical protein